MCARVYICVWWYVCVIKKIHKAFYLFFLLWLHSFTLILVLLYFQFHVTLSLMVKLPVASKQLILNTHLHMCVCVCAWICLLHARLHLNKRTRLFFQMPHRSRQLRRRLQQRQRMWLRRRSWLWLIVVIAGDNQNHVCVFFFPYAPITHLFCAFCCVHIHTHTLTHSLLHMCGLYVACMNHLILYAGKARKYFL